MRFVAIVRGPGCFDAYGPFETEDEGHRTGRLAVRIRGGADPDGTYSYRVRTLLDGPVCVEHAWGKAQAFDRVQCEACGARGTVVADKP